jgi:hypothetical protein
MTRVWFLLPALLAAAPAPKPVHVRFALKTSPPELTSRAVAALQHGLFSDSLIVPATDSQRLRWGMTIPTDSVGRSQLATVAQVKGKITAQGGAVELCVVLLNVLLRPMSGPDSLRIRPEKLDSALAAIGRRYAEVLARQRRPDVSSTSCAY